MKKLTSLILAITLCSIANSQNVGIGTVSPDASAMLDIRSTSKGLLLPRMNTATINAISSPARGLLVLDTATNQLMVNMGTPVSPNWQTIVFKSGWSLAGNSNIDSSTNFIGTTDLKPLLFRVNNLPAGQIHPFNKNTAFGLSSLLNNSSGKENTAMGYQALNSNTIGNYNAAVGNQALYSNIAGTGNIAMGYQALFANTSGSSNVASGVYSLASNTTGNGNSAYGYQSLLFNITGSLNTATGAEALFSNNSGSYNTSTGYASMRTNSTGNYNSSVGAYSLFSNTSGSLNAATGYQAMYNNTSGGYNTANGYQSLYNNTTGGFNTAYGAQALDSNITGNSNTAIGTFSLYNNLTGDYNTATGAYALFDNESGSFNTSMGYYALSSNQGGGNTAIGYKSMLPNLDGYENIGLGYLTLVSNNHGYINTALGSESLYKNTIGHQNTAVGYSALYNNIDGSVNTAIGGQSLVNLYHGDYNIAIGYNSGAYSLANTLYNSIVIGSNTFAQNDNYAILSTPTTVWNGGHQLWSTYSDARIKTNIKEDVAGLSFIMKLKPVTYNRSLGEETKVTGNNISDYPSKYDVEKIRYTGFVAQDVEKAAQETGFDFSGITKPKSSTDLYSLSYESFVVPLVKAMQEQQLIIKQQQLQNLTLQSEVNMLKQKTESLVLAIDKLTQNK